MQTLKSGTEVTKRKGSSSPQQPAEPPLSQRAALLAEDEGLQLEESTVLHHFTFHRAKPCPRIAICVLLQQGQTLLHATPTKPLGLQ